MNRYANPSGAVHSLSGFFPPKLWLASVGNTVYYDYAADQVRPSDTPMALSSSDGKTSKANKVAQDDESSASSDSESFGSMGSEELAMILDYAANLEDKEEDITVLEAFLAASSKGVEGMDMDQTETWTQTANDKVFKPRKPKPKRMKGGKIITEEPSSGQSSPAPFTPNSRSGKGRSRGGTPKSRGNTPKSQHSAMSTPTSSGKKDRRAQRGPKPSPVPIQLLRKRYAKDVSFVVAIDPMSKLMDDDSLIILPHSQVTRKEVLEAATIDKVVSDMEAAGVTVVDVSEPSLVLMDPAAMDITVEVEDPFEESSESDESTDSDENSDDALAYPNDMDDSGDAEEVEESEEIEDDMDDDLDAEDADLNEDEAELLAQLEEAGVFDSDSEDADSDAEEDSSDDLGSSEDGSDDEEENDETVGPIVISAAIHTPGRQSSDSNRMDVLTMEKDLGFSRAGTQMKHDSRSRSTKKHDRRASPAEVGEFPSKKKLSKAEKKKQKKRSRDDVPLEYRELETWNELIRDFISHAPLGTPMPFSPMGRYQRKQLHWLSEFYGLRSQSFGSGTRRMTSVFTTKRTVLHEFALSLAAIKAIHQGNHPFMVSSEQLEQDAERFEREAMSPSKRRVRESPSSKSSKKKQLNKSRSPLVKGGGGSKKDKARSRPPRRSRMDHDSDSDSEDSHLGLDFTVKITTARVVGAGASHIPVSNIGHMMLRRLGWDNTGLGRDEQGIAQPIAAVIKSGRGGLGS